MLFYFNFLLSVQENMKSIFELSAFALLRGDTLEHSDLLRGNLDSFSFTLPVLFCFVLFYIQHLREHASIVMVGIVKTR